MKRYTDLTTEELEALTGEEIQKFIDIEVAFAGVQMVPKPIPYESYKFQVKPTAEAYSVKGVLVADKATAEILQNATVYQENYNYPDYDHKYIEAKTEATIETKQFYAKNDLEQVKAQVVASKKDKEVYDAANKLYCEYQQQTDGFQTEVLDAVNAARRLMDSRRQAQAAYDKYLALADSNVEIAKNFFRAAFRGYPAMIEFILGEKPEITPTVPVEGEDHEELAA